MNLELGEFLKKRRSCISPADLGLPAGVRRRVPGLRRDEVALLADMSVDYYIELEQGRSRSPSVQILAALGKVLRLNDDEMAHLLHLAGHRAPPGAKPAQTRRALGQLLEQLDGTPAMIITDLHHALAQNRLSQALIGPLNTGYAVEENLAYLWFTAPETRQAFAPEEHAKQSRALVSDLRAAAARRGDDGPCDELLARLRAIPEFAALWNVHDVAVSQSELRRVVHPTLGVIEVSQHSLCTADAGQRLLWMVPSDEGTIDKLKLLDVPRAWGGRLRDDGSGAVRTPVATG